MNCRNCSNRLGRGNNRTGLCRACYLADPSTRTRLSERARNLRLWEKGHAVFHGEGCGDAWARRNAALRDKWIGHIPVEYRDLYRHFTRHVRLSAAEATSLVMQQIEADQRRAA